MSDISQITKEMTAGYITAALWADCTPLAASDPNHPDHKDQTWESGGLEHLDVCFAQRAQIAELIQIFRNTIPEYLEGIYAECVGDGTDYTWAEKFGHDLRFTAAGHGTGFWDRGLVAQVGKSLTYYAEAFGDFPIYQVDENTARFDL